MTKRLQSHRVRLARVSLTHEARVRLRESSRPRDGRQGKYAAQNPLRMAHGSYLSPFRRAFLMAKITTITFIATNENNVQKSTGSPNFPSLLF